MSDTEKLDLFAGTEGEPFATVDVRIVTLAEGNDTGAEPGSYFGFPGDHPDTPIQFFGPFPDPETAREQASASVLNAMQSSANTFLKDIAA